MTNLTRRTALVAVLIVAACTGDPAPSVTPDATAPTNTATPSATAVGQVPTDQPTTQPTLTPGATATVGATPTLGSTPFATQTPFSTPAPDGPAGMTLLGRWKTRFVPSGLNGDGANINVPAKLIDGTIVRPGESFNFIGAVVPITEPPYHLGGVLRNGQIIEDGVLGGGMCSASTTLFNAAMRAGLTVVERHAHALYISRYPVGLDATILGTATRGQNVVFSNDTANDIYVRGIPGRRRVIFEIYGISDGRTVHLSEPRIENLREAKMYMQYTDSLGPGVQDHVNDRYDGFESWVTRTVRDANGNVIHSNIYHSTYRVLEGLIMVGRYVGDPPSGTRILAADYPGRPDPPDPPDPTPKPSRTPRPPAPTPPPGPTPTPVPPTPVPPMPTLPPSPSP